MKRIIAAAALALCSGMSLAGTSAGSLADVKTL